MHRARTAHIFSSFPVTTIYVPMFSAFLQHMSACPTLQAITKLEMQKKAKKPKKSFEAATNWLKFQIELDGYTLHFYCLPPQLTREQSLIMKPAMTKRRL